MPQKQQKQQKQHKNKQQTRQGNQKKRKVHKRQVRQQLPGRCLRLCPSGGVGPEQADESSRPPQRQNHRQNHGQNFSQTRNRKKPLQDGGSAMSLLEMRHVSRVYGQGAAEVQALHDINLDVDAGMMVAVMGPSGSGKSTLLTIAGSLEDPSSGEVRVCGEDLVNLSHNAKARLRRRTIGYVFQDFNLLPGLTAAENVALPLELDGVPASVTAG